MYLRDALFAMTLATIASAAIADPKQDYLLHCRGCHLPDGRSVPPAVPTLRNVIGKIVATPEGRDYVIRVPGVSQSSLADKQLASVLNWVLSEFNADTLPADFKPYSEEEVGKARRIVLPDPLKHRTKIWQD